LAVPSQTLIRDLATAPPVYSGQGRRPQRPWQRVEPWATSLAEDAWRRVDVRDGATGPLVVDIVTRRVVSRTPRRPQGDEAMVVVRRYRDRDTQQVVQVDGYLSHAAPATPLWECARVAKAAPRMEEGRQRRTSEAGLADDEVRHWTGGHQHPTLAFLATWFLVTATQRGKKGTPAITLPPMRQGIASSLHEGFQGGTMSQMLHARQQRLRRNALARFDPWKQQNRLAPLNLHKRAF